MSFILVESIDGSTSMVNMKNVTHIKVERRINLHHQDNEEYVVTFFLDQTRLIGPHSVQETHQIVVDTDGKDNIQWNVLNP